MDLLIIGGTATGTGRAWPLAQGLLLSLGVAAVVFVAARCLTRPEERIAMRQGGSAIRAVLVVLGILVCEMFLVKTTPRELAFVGEALYYVVLFGGAIVLASWAHSSDAAAIWAAIVVLVLPAALQAAQFAGDREARFQDGPEVYLFMFWGLAAHLNMLPLDAVVAWSGWRTWATYRARRSGRTRG